jgi:ethanolamine utilization microcompartment shell protein EutL
VKVTPPPTETNFACAWLTGISPGDLAACEAAAVAFAAAVVEVAARPHGR